MFINRIQDKNKVCQIYKVEKFVVVKNSYLGVYRIVKIVKFSVELKYMKNMIYNIILVMELKCNLILYFQKIFKYLRQYVKQIKVGVCVWMGKGIGFRNERNQINLEVNK